MEQSDLGDLERRIFTQVTNVNIIEVEGVSGWIGHGYFHSSPSASSDLILIISGGSLPGEPDRPLKHEVLNFWTMPKNYPGPPAVRD